MPDFRRATCQGCKKHRDEVGPISWGGLCVTCAKQRVLDNLTGLDAKTGPEWHRWRRSMAASVGGVLLDELPPDR